MTQQTELPENSEARVLVAHLNMDVDTDHGVKVNINANRETLMLMLSAVFVALDALQGCLYNNDNQVVMGI